MLQFFREESSEKGLEEMKKKELCRINEEIVC